MFAMLASSSIESCAKVLAPDSNLAALVSVELAPMLAERDEFTERRVCLLTGRQGEFTSLERERVVY